MCHPDGSASTTSSSFVFLTHQTCTGTVIRRTICVVTRVLRVCAPHLYVHRLLLCRVYAAAMKCLPATDVHDGASIIARPLRWHVCQLGPPRFRGGRHTRRRGDCVSDRPLASSASQRHHCGLAAHSLGTDRDAGGVAGRWCVYCSTLATVCRQSNRGDGTRPTTCRALPQWAVSNACCKLRSSCCCRARTSATSSAMDGSAASAGTACC